MFHVKLVLPVNYLTCVCASELARLEFVESHNARHQDPQTKENQQTGQTGPRDRHRPEQVRAAKATQRCVSDDVNAVALARVCVVCCLGLDDEEGEAEKHGCEEKNTYIYGMFTIA